MLLCIARVLLLQRLGAAGVARGHDCSRANLEEATQRFSLGHQSTIKSNPPSDAGLTRCPSRW